MTLFKILFPIICITGIYFLFKSIGKIMEVYGGKKIEFPATSIMDQLELDAAGTFEIAYKRPSLTGIIPSDCHFKLKRHADQQELKVFNKVNLLGMRKDMSGSRVVPIAEFNLEQPGTYTLRMTESEDYKKGDKIQITAKTGSKGFIAIFAIIISAFATIGGLVLSILAFMNKL
ncbi:hypothetical protein MUK70_02615 [Dyadobacter chenwenxiniae]|uniref:Uncharacterized protein n=1 Tax=Dyadobacter chenwenxiniae TaxID=2906456 RepID=A0A9X1PMM6_9BACT|nr:hypothetical protein [Dyadobacter chenwenxiniae]MCF0062358.1 hypothetical protein [Dyadobacter chenwenxiniae]UON83887.1 hypothetical protein MUK70_02615 [Dyadobacter chenwenxiniae]